MKKVASTLFASDKEMFAYEFVIPDEIIFCECVVFAQDRPSMSTRFTLDIPRNKKTKRYIEVIAEKREMINICFSWMDRRTGVTYTYTYVHDVDQNLKSNLLLLLGGITGKHFPENN